MDKIMDESTCSPKIMDEGTHGPKIMDEGEILGNELKNDR